MATKIADPITSQIARARLPLTTMGGWSRLPCMQPPVQAQMITGARRLVNAITGVVSFDETPAAFSALQSDKSEIKIMVKPGA
jgi:threonine dehydrogenase-like Zn-dependent dehydrogenase